MSAPDHPRARAWLVCASVAALVAIYSCVVTYWLSAHTEPTRYVATTPGELVSTDDFDITLLSLQKVAALPKGEGETEEPVAGEAYVLATIRLTVKNPDRIAGSCGRELVATDGSTWEYELLTAVDLKTTDPDYCDAVKVGQPAEVTIGYKIPAAAVGRVAGIVVPRLNGQPGLVLVPPT